MARVRKPRCDRIKRSDAQVVWDDPGAPWGNRQKTQAHGLTEDEVESVLLDDDAAVVPNRSHPEHCLVFGYTYTARFIAVVFEILDADYPVIRPITAFEPDDE
jgi:uncharacterized DUF497 family protein